MVINTKAMIKCVILFKEVPVSLVVLCICITKNKVEFLYRVQAFLQ